jgi:hypothetical protein
MTTEMHVPAHWRNERFMLNPNKEGYRPGILLSPINQFADKPAKQIQNSLKVEANEVIVFQASVSYPV